MPAIDVEGVGLFYEEKGSGEPVVFVHGIPTDYRAWSLQTGPFSAKYRTISMSRRYAAPNVRMGDLLDSTVSNNAADLKGLIEKLGISPVHLVGHSYGGFVSAVVAADHQDMVRSLVLVEPAISTLLVADAESQAQLFSLLLRSPSVALAARKFQTKSLYPSFRALDAGDADRALQLNVEGVQGFNGKLADFPEDVRKMMTENTKTVGELRTRFPRFTAAEAGRITCKTLVLNGESGAPWLKRIGELATRSIPKGESAIISQAKHFPHLENSEEFNRKVLAFLGRMD